MAAKLMILPSKDNSKIRLVKMPEDYEEGWPLRKDFPVEGRGWRDDFQQLSQDSG